MCQQLLRDGLQGASVCGHANMDLQCPQTTLFPFIYRAANPPALGLPGNGLDAVPGQAQEGFLLFSIPLFPPSHLPYPLPGLPWNSHKSSRAGQELGWACVEMLEHPVNLIPFISFIPAGWTQSIPEGVFLCFIIHFSPLWAPVQSGAQQFVLAPPRVDCPSWGPWVTG